MSTGLKWLCVAVAIPVVVVFAAIYSAYWYGTSVLPVEIKPSAREYPAELRQMYWRSMGGTGDIRIRRLNPLTMAWTVFRMVEDARDGRIKPTPPDLQALTNIARIRISGIEPSLPTFRRSLAEIALMIRISREWGEKQVVDTVLAEQWFGRGARGFDQASNAYFGVDANKLSPEEVLSLLVIERGPSSFDPTCRRERFVERYSFLAKRVDLPAGDDAIRRATARLRATECR